MNATRVFRRAEYFLWTAALLILGYCGFVLLKATIYQNYQSRKLDQTIQEGVTQNSPPPASPSDNLIGRLEIDRVGLSAMVLKGTDSRTLDLAVGHLEGTALPGEPGNVVLAGHRDTFFRPLNQIRKKDTVTLTTVAGTHRYTVESIAIVKPNDTYVLQSSEKPLLTLVTCYPFHYVGAAPKRFVVQAREVPDDQAATTSPAAFSR